MSKDMGSVLRWPGSKHKARKLLHALAPLDGYRELREPFFGSGSMIRDLVPDKAAWVNDKNELLMQFWQGLRGLSGDPEFSIDEAMRLKWSMRTEQQKRQCFLDACDRIRSGKRMPLDFWVANRFAVSAIVSTDRRDIASFGSAFKRDGFVHVARGKFQYFRDVLQRPNIRLDCGDYGPLIEAPGTDIWLVLDPPCRLITHGSPIYQHSFSRKQHTDLCERLRACPHRWLLTIHNSAMVRHLYDGYRIRLHRYTGSMPHRTYDRWKTELFITNY